jgi:hypothetical protein
MPFRIAQNIPLLQHWVIAVNCRLFRGWTELTRSRLDSFHMIAER